ncbi:MAG: extracellular solute-binding protein [Lachnospiraceae bacterium]|jgi:putative aldouronate transport system substrate-binding protein|nr:extracellular solute-binding protein [Lachnospiraceae bacterium]
MMKRRNALSKAAALALAAVLATVALAGCGASGQAGDKAAAGAGAAGGAQAADPAGSGDTRGLPLTKEEQEALDAGLIALDGSLPIIRDPDAFESKYGRITAIINNPAERVIPVGDLAMCRRWFEDTGVAFDWQAVPNEGYTEKLNLMLASGEGLPDVFWSFGDGKSGNTVVQYADQDVFLPTEALINNDMPHLRKILDDHPVYWSEITAPNGHTYGFPYIEEMYGLVLTGGPWMINKMWLDKVGRDIPTTLDEWVDCMRAFRDAGDLNGNGIADETPIATQFKVKGDTFGSYNLFYRITGAFGCADSICDGNAYANHLRMVDGAVAFTAKDEAFRKTAEFFHMLYGEGLLWDGSFEADDSALYRNSLLRQPIALAGSFGTWSDQDIQDVAVHDEYVALPRLQGPGGMTGFENNYSELQDSSDTCISATCRFPHVVARFVDYLVGDPALSIQSNWGAEGYVYEKDETGVLRTPVDPDGHFKPMKEGADFENFGKSRANSTTARGSMIVLDGYYEVYAGYAFDAVQLLEGQKTNGKEAIMAEYDSIPKVLMTTDEIARLAQIQPTISDIVERYINTWITGGVTDDNWNAYLSALEGAGVNELVGIYQTAIDRSSR